MYLPIKNEKNHVQACVCQKKAVNLQRFLIEGIVPEKKGLFSRKPD